MKYVTRMAGIALIVVATVEQSPAQSLRTVAITGDLADSNVATSMTFTQLGPPSINDDGEVAFSASAVAPGQTQRGGAWAEHGGASPQLIALNGDPAPGIPNAIYADLELSYPSINDSDKVAFRARFPLTTGITSTNNSAVYVMSWDGPPVAVQREGSAAPGGPTGGIFSDLNDVIRQRYSKFNELGQITGVDWLRNGVGSVSSTNDTGIWRTDLTGATTLIAREAAVAADVSPTRYYGNIAGLPNLNDVGQIAFSAPLRSTPTGSTAGGGAWLVSPTGVATLLARDGQAAEDGSTYATVGRPALNNLGDYAYAAALNVAGTVTIDDDSGIWKKLHAGDRARVVREGTQAPGTEPGVGFKAFSELVMNHDGKLAFAATLAPVPGSGASMPLLRDSGIWSERDGGFTLVAREGDQPVGVPAGVEFDTFNGPAFNASGQAAFMGNLRGAGVTAANDLGIWAQDSDGALQLIVREGDQLDVDDGPAVELRTVAATGFYAEGGGEDGSRVGFNQVGQLTFIAQFTDGTSGIFVSNLVSTITPQFEADFDEDGDVDGDDLADWQTGFGENGTAEHGDGDADGDLDVDGDDFLTWQRQLGSDADVPATSSLANVPEPAAGRLMLLVAAASPLVRSFTRRIRRV